MRSRSLVLAGLLLQSASVLAQHMIPGAPATTAATPPSSPPPPPPPPPTSSSISSLSMASHTPSEPATPRFEPPAFHATLPSEPSPPRFEAPTFHSSPPVTSVPEPRHSTTVELPKGEPLIPHSSVRDGAAGDIKHSAEAPRLEMKPVLLMPTEPVEQSDKDKAELRGGKPCPKDKSCGTATSTNAAGKNQTPATSVPVPQQCQPGTSLNRTSCIPGVQACATGTVWDGAACFNNTALCGSFTSRAANITAEARGSRSEMERACLKDPNSDECIRLTQVHNGEVLRYRMLLNEAAGQITSSCQATLPDPMTL